MTPPAPASSPVSARLTPLALACRALLCLGLAGGQATAWAQATTAAVADDAPLALRPSDVLQSQLPADVRSATPTFVWGERISGQTNVQTVVEGQAELRRHDTVIRAGRLQLDHANNDAQATGDVSIVRNGNRYEGPELQINLDSYHGFFTQPRYQLLANNGQGEAERVDFLGENLSVAHRATYTTCTAPPQALPDWWIGASRLELDSGEEEGRAHSGALYFKGVPLLAAPYVSFPLSDKRKSGLLPPTINLDNISGFELTLPYYWNIAPQFDATLYPTLMTKRGVDLGGEFRYLQPDFNGQVRAAYMPSDKLTGTDRWGTSVQHNHTLDASPLGLGQVGLGLNFNRVSDDAYWRDFPRATPSLTQRLLPNNAVLSGQLGAVGVTAGVYTWQTLQDSSAPITAPYDRVPQVDLRWGQVNQRLGAVQGLDWSVTGQGTRFTTSRSPTVTATQADLNGSRLLAVAQLTRKWQAPGWFVRPKAQLHLSQYSFDQALYDGRRDLSRAVPTASLDSGLVFERDTHFWGRSLVQTLEPRAFYTYTPYRNQNHLPSYDSAAKDLNVGTVWTENVFGGNDRIADLHALTLGATSKFIEPDSGRELARFGVAQRLRFADQNVVLPGGTPVTDRLSDVLLGASLNWDPRWSFDSSVQFNPSTKRSQRTTLSASYQPGPYRVVSTAYRLQRAGGLLPASEQVEVGWQWPLNDLWDANHRSASRDPQGQGLGPDRWYGVGRINYSMPDRKIVDLVAGFEYDAGCWLARVVLERLQRGSATTGQRVLFQLEFSGFTRLGSNPLQTLKTNVPRYQYLREQVEPPSRFGRYE